ncbi:MULTISPECIES: hypothetical protein [unclassified Bradyrhizobium]|nr:MULTISPECIES: hypothetical protein [unclassified Bradyrhizobium]
MAAFAIGQPLLPGRESGCDQIIAGDLFGLLIRRLRMPSQALETTFLAA